MICATLAATLVEMADGRPALLVEMGPELGLGPAVVDPADEDLGIADPSGPKAPG